MNNNGTGERLVALETKFDIMNETINATRNDVKELTKAINKLIPTLATKDELNTHTCNDEIKLENLRKASKLQVWQVGITGTGIGAVIMYLLTFYLENKK